MKKVITAFVIFVICFAVNGAVRAQYFTLEQLNAFLTDERERWDVRGDGKIGLEEAIHALQVAAGIQADGISSPPGTDTGTINVLGRGNETYYIHDSTGSGDPLFSVGLNDEIELFPGTYTVALNNSTQTVTVKPGENDLLAAGNVSVAGLSAGKFYVCDSMENELDSAFADDEISLLPGDYIIRVNNTEQSVNVQSGEKTTVTMGAITVSSRFLTGNSRYYVYDTDGNSLSNAQTNREIELLPGTYTVSLHGAVRTAEVRAGEKTTVASGTVTVSSSFLTGNSRYYVYDTEGNRLSDTYTNKEIELFPGTYTVSLHGISQTAEVRAGEKTTLEAGTVVVSSILFAENSKYYVYDTDGNSLSNAYTNKEVELFPGTYTVSLHDTAQTAEVRAGEKTTLASGTVTVSSSFLTGNARYYAYDLNGKKLSYTSTNQEIELFPGAYMLSLHDIVQPAEVRAGEKTTLASGTVTVSSSFLTGNARYYAYDLNGKELSYTSTNQEIELFPGTYTLSLHDTVQNAEVLAGEKTTLATGTVTVSGTGNTIYDVHDSTGVGDSLDSAKTNEAVELFPGDYIVRLNNTERAAIVQAGKETTLVAGTVTIPETESWTHCYVQALDRNQLYSSYSSSRKKLEFFPGTYTVTVGDNSQTVVVQAGQDVLVNF